MKKKQHCFVGKINGIYFALNKKGYGETHLWLQK
jgi:hypothetical protein